MCYKICPPKAACRYAIMSKPLVRLVRKRTPPADDTKKKRWEKKKTQREAILFWVTQDSVIINHHYCFALNDCRLWHHTLTSRSFFHILRLQKLWKRTSSEWLIALKPGWHYSPFSIGNHCQKAAEVIPVFFFFFYSLFNLSPLCSWREKKRLDLSFCFIFCFLQPHRRARHLVSFARRWEAVPGSLFVCLFFHLHLAEICLTVQQCCFSPGIRHQIKSAAFVSTCPSAACAPECLGRIEASSCSKSLLAGFIEYINVFRLAYFIMLVTTMVLEPDWEEKQDNLIFVWIRDWVDSAVRALWIMLYCLLNYG